MCPLTSVALIKLALYISIPHPLHQLPPSEYHLTSNAPIRMPQLKSESSSTGNHHPDCAGVQILCSIGALHDSGLLSWRQVTQATCVNRHWESVCSGHKEKQSDCEYLGRSLCSPKLGSLLVTRLNEITWCVCAETGSRATESR